MNAARVSPQDRMNMIMMGLSANNPEHIKEYFQSRGRPQVTMQEAIENVSYLVGQDAFGKKNLGSGREAEVDPMRMDGNTAARSANPRNFRDQLMNDLGDYGVEGRPASNYITSEQLGLGTRRPHPAAKQVLKEGPVSKEKLQKAYKYGYNYSIDYLNNFIKNIKQPSGQGRIGVYKSLQRIAEVEQKLGSKKLVEAFRKGCAKAEQELYAKMKS